MNAFKLTLPNLNPHDRPTIFHTLDRMASRCVMAEVGSVLTIAGHTSMCRKEFADTFNMETAIPRDEWAVEVVPLS